MRAIGREMAGKHHRLTPTAPIMGAGSVRGPVKSLEDLQVSNPYPEGAVGLFQPWGSQGHRAGLIELAG